MWKNGKVCSIPDCGAAGSGAASSGRPAITRATAPESSVFIRLVTWLRWVAIAPFGSPVVPEV